MKIFVKNFLGALAVMLTIIFVSTPGEAAKKTVAVMPFENVSNYQAANVAEIMTEQLIATIMNSGQYTVTERTQMATVLREQGFQNIAADPNTAVEVGKVSGANYSVIGKVTLASAVINPIYKLFSDGKNSGLSAFTNKYKAKVELNIRFVDNGTGELIFSDMITGSKTGQSVEMALAGACREASERFLKKLQENNPFVARVADISGENLYIDQGSDSGLRKGETLMVFREGDPIIVNGKIVDMKRTSICKAKVLEVNAEYSICKADKAGAVRKGDIMRRR